MTETNIKNDVLDSADLVEVDSCGCAVVPKNIDAPTKAECPQLRFRPEALSSLRGVTVPTQGKDKKLTVQQRRKKVCQTLTDFLQKALDIP